MRTLDPSGMEEAAARLRNHDALSGPHERPMLPAMVDPSGMEEAAVRLRNYDAGTVHERPLLPVMGSRPGRSRSPLPSRDIMPTMAELRRAEMWLTVALGDPATDPGPLQTDMPEFQADVDGGGVGSAAASLTATRPAGWDIRAWAAFVTSEFRGRPWTAAWAGPAGYQLLRDVDSATSGKRSSSGMMEAEPSPADEELFRSPESTEPVEEAEYYPTPGGHEEWWTEVDHATGRTTYMFRNPEDADWTHWADAGARVVKRRRRTGRRHVGDDVSQ